MPIFSSKEKIDTTSINTVIGEHTRILGNLEGKGNLRIDGEVEGNLKVESLVVIGPKGRVRGEIQANQISISGCVEGNCIARDRIELQSSAVISGNLTSMRIEMKDGAKLQGKVEIMQNEIPKS